jgi:hypothetical protein
LTFLFIVEKAKHRISEILQAKYGIIEFPAGSLKRNYKEVINILPKSMPGGIGAEKG